MLSSRLEGGANVLGEAITAGVPVIASRIAGNIGLLGKSYDGYFVTGNTEGLMKLMLRAESEATYRSHLRQQCASVAWKFDPALEKECWRTLLAEITRA